MTPRKSAPDHVLESTGRGRDSTDLDPHPAYALDRRAEHTRDRRRLAALGAATAGGLLSLSVAMLGPYGGGGDAPSGPAGQEQLPIASTHQGG